MSRDGAVIRRAQRESDQYGDVVGRIDGDLIRRAQRESDRYGDVVGRVEGMPGEVAIGAAAVCLGLLP